MLPDSVHSALHLMLLPLFAIAAVVLLAIVAILRVGTRKALRGIRPLWTVVLINLVIITLGSAVKVAPFYLHGCVWSPRIIRLINMVQSGLLLVLIIWVFVSFRKWIKSAKYIDAQLKAGTNSPNL
ncbi:hypothetical protein LLG46_07850 [bacterium]|nr:hypothetical protein [bacterium]